MSRDLGSSAVTASTSPYGVVYCGIYARYSSDKQRRASIEDQIRNCRGLAERKGWLVLDTHIFIDEDRTGQTLNRREGFKAMMDATKKNPSDVQYIVVDDVTRLSRRKADLFFAAIQSRPEELTPALPPLNLGKATVLTTEIATLWCSENNKNGLLALTRHTMQLFREAVLLILLVSMIEPRS